MSGEHFLLSSRKLFSLPGYDGKWLVTMAVQEMLVTMAVQEFRRGLKTSRKNFPKRNFCSDLQFLFRPTARSADTASRRSDAVVPEGRLNIARQFTGGWMANPTVSRRDT
jgi:hypothetical protein